MYLRSLCLPVRGLPSQALPLLLVRLPAIPPCAVCTTHPLQGQPKLTYEAFLAALDLVAAEKGVTAEEVQVCGCCSGHYVTGGGQKGLVRACGGTRSTLGSRGAACPAAAHPTCTRRRQCALQTVRC
jgi:hypothetical protein